MALALLSSGCAASAADKAKQALDETVKIELASQPIRWNPENRNDFDAGELEWAGTIEISSDHKRFGGWSGLSVSADGSTLLAVSDEAQWFTAQILYDEKGRLSGVGEGTIAPLLGLDGKPVASKSYGDAEGLAVSPGVDPLKGDAYVSFERHHRIWRYDLGKDGFKAKPEQIVTERQLGKLPWNEGIEAVAATLPLIGGDKQRLLAISENGRDPRGNVRGFLIEGAKVKRFSLRLNDPFRPT
ncbi:MAG: esterase-like activity of phytase family protein, partial [Parvibaculum sp.]|uniref:esterase-like activity of phytase family protein n=1 Tax=Parvibaculum sp. TaxID=2024848 RepID=UPI0025D64E7C